MSFEDFFDTVVKEDQAEKAEAKKQGIPVAQLRAGNEARAKARKAQVEPEAQRRAGEPARARRTSAQRWAQAEAKRPNAFIEGILDHDRPSFGEQLEGTAVVSGLRAKESAIRSQLTTFFMAPQEFMREFGDEKALKMFKEGREKAGDGIPMWDAPAIDRAVDKAVKSHPDSVQAKKVLDAARAFQKDIGDKVKASTPEEMAYAAEMAEASKKSGLSQALFDTVQNWPNLLSATIGRGIDAVAPGVGLGLSTSFMAMQEEGDYTGMSDALKVDSDFARPYARQYAVISGAIEQAQQLQRFANIFGGKKIGNKIKNTVLRKASGILFDMGIEATEEVLQQGAQHLITVKMLRDYVDVGGELPSIAAAKDAGLPLTADGKLDVHSSDFKDAIIRAAQSGAGVSGVTSLLGLGVSGVRFGISEGLVSQEGERVLAQLNEQEAKKRAADWAETNPEEAANLAGTYKPSRRDWPKALGRVTADVRQAVSNFLQEKLHGKAPEGESTFDLDTEQQAAAELRTEIEETVAVGDGAPVGETVVTPEMADQAASNVESNKAGLEAARRLSPQHKQEMLQVERDLIEKEAKEAGIDIDGKTIKDARAILDEAKKAKPAPQEKPAETIKDQVEPEKTIETKKDQKAAPLADRLVERIKTGEKLTWQSLFKMADEAFGGTRAEGTYQSTDAYEALELAVNKTLGRTTDTDTEGAIKTVAEIEEQLSLLPTQTNRSGEKDLMQQFSTPPHYAYAANWIAGLRGDDVALEPSAGTGSLATHAKASGVKVIGNELSPRRAELLKQIADEVYTEDAEQLANVLPESVRPSVVVMNPPFSQAGTRMKGKKMPMTGARHIEQALKVLKPGGRLVAIVGKGMAFGKPTFAGWWNKIGKEYNVRANMGVSGDVYAKYGTRFGTQVLVIDKVAPDGKAPISGVAETVQELIQSLQEVRNDRPAGTDVTVEQKSEGSTDVVQREDSATDVSPDRPTDVGDRKREGRRRDPGRTGDDAATSRTDDTGDGGQRGSQVSDGRRDRPGPRTESGRDTGDVSRDAASTDVGERGRVSPGKKDAVDVKKGKRVESTEDSGTFETYSPAVSLEGAQPHPAPLVESAAMASVESPDVSYQPSIPKEIVDSGALSAAQLEPIIMAGHMHGQTVPTTTAEQQEYQELYPGQEVPKEKRRGFFVGDGTGVGKGREAAGFILDNWNQGRKKAVWVSEKEKLFNPAVGDWTDLGGQKDDLFYLGKVKAGESIKRGNGVAFATYDTIGTSSRGRKDEKKTRIEQLVDWFGTDYDGVVVFDESHNMGNAVAVKGKRGKKKVAAKALMGIEIQRRLPNARVVYMSATGATEVSNLAYTDRLGLWGEGTPFANREDFVSKVSAGGIAAMELVARDMKALGLYIARTLSFKGVGYGRLTHELSEEQEGLYNTIAKAWQVVLRNINEALEITAGFEDKNGDIKIDPGRKKNALGQFWGTHQRFFNLVLTSMQTPTVIKSMQADLTAGKSVVLQLINTMEADTERALNSMEDGADLEALDITPRDQLIRMVEASFPVVQMEQYVDANGNTRTRPVEDSKGNKVLNREAVAKRDKLIDDLASIAVPEGPLDQIINHFGHKNVSEVTNRKRRVIVNSKGKREIQKRGKLSSSADISSFMDGDKRILIFSQAGGTGASYHASREAKNQQQRVHYVLQPGWRADIAIQGLGRSHRSNQAHKPIFNLVETNLPGHKRFISTIARRLEQLGALSRGQRDTGGGGLFSEADNMESSHAYDALQKLARDIVSGVTEIDVEDFEMQTGLSLRTEEGGRNAKPLDTSQFLNRLLSLDIDMQNKVFEAYSERLEREVEIARATGSLDTGTEDVKAVKIEKVDENVIHTDPRTGVETKHVELKVFNKTKKITWASAKNNAAEFVKNKRSGEVYVLKHGGNRTNADSGKIVQLWSRWSPSGKTVLDKADAHGKYSRISEEEAQAAWQKKLEALPELKEQSMHMVTGVLLPIWDKLAGRPQVKRAETEDGERFLGRVIPNAEIGSTLENMGATRNVKTPDAATAQDMLLKGDDIKLDNRWAIRSVTVSGDKRIEVTGITTPSGFQQIRDMGGFVERHQYRNRAYLPVGDKFGPAYDRLVKTHAVSDIISDADDTFGMAGSTSGVKGRGGLEQAKVGPKKGAKAPGVQGTDIRNAVERLWPELTLRDKATFKRRFPGWYNPGLAEIRQKDVNDILVAMHELGHHFDRQMGMWSKTEGLPSGITKELVELGRALYGKRKPAGGYRVEGFAEFIREYLTGGDVQEMAPLLYEWFTTDYLTSRPKEAAKIRELEQLVTKYRVQTPGQAVRAFRSPIKQDWSPIRTVSRIAGWAYKGLVDINIVIRFAMKKAGINMSGLAPEDNPYLLATMHSMSAASYAETAAIIETQDLAGNRTGKGLEEVLNPVTSQGQDALERFTDYIVALRAVFLHKRGIRSGISHQDAVAVVEANHSEEFGVAAQEVTMWSRRVMSLLVEAGVMTPDEFKNIVDLNPVYVPFQRQFKKGEIRAGKGTGRGKVVFKIKGDTREILNPFDALLIQSEKIASTAMQADVLRAMVRLYDANKGRKRGALAKLMSEIPPPMEATRFSMEQIKREMAAKAVELGADAEEVAASMLETWDENLTVFTKGTQYKGKNNVISVVVNGERRFFEVSTDMYNMLNDLNRESRIGGIVGRVSRAAVGMQRLGATGLNPGFGLIRNFQRDTGTTNITFDYARGGPIASLAGIVEDIAGSEMQRKFAGLGVPMAGWVGSSKRSVRALRDRVTAGTKGRRIFVTMKHPIDALRTLFGVTEAGPRLAEFKAAYKYAKDQGMSDKSAAVIATVAAKDVSVNFSRAGHYGRALNEVILFVNARIQSIDKLGRTFWKHPVRTVARGASWLTFSAMLSYYRNRDEEWWQELPPYEKWQYLHFEMPGGVILRLPLPFEFGILFGALPVAAIESQRNPGAFTEALNQLRKATTEGIMPALLSPMADIWRNEDWKGSSIVPENIKRSRLPEDQFTSQTTEMAKFVGKVVGWSPAKIEHVVNAYSGGLYRRVAKTLASISDPSRIGAGGDFSSVPVVGTLFLRNNTSRLAGDFYERQQELWQLKGSKKASLAEIGELTSIDRLSKKLSRKWGERRDVIASDAKGSEIKKDTDAITEEVNAMIRKHNAEKPDYKELGAGVTLYKATSPKADDEDVAEARRLLEGMSKAEMTNALKKEVKYRGGAVKQRGRGSKLTPYGKRIHRLKKLD